MTFDVTPIFWDLIHGINNIPLFDDLQQTDSYKVLRFYIDQMEFFNENMENDKHFMLFIENIQNYLYFETLEELFYDTLRFYKTHYPKSLEYFMMEEAIEKIEASLHFEKKVDDLSDMFKNI